MIILICHSRRALHDNSYHSGGELAGLAGLRGRRALHDDRALHHALQPSAGGWAGGRAGGHGRRALHDDSH